MRVVVVDVSDQIRALNKTTTSLRRTNSFTRAMATLQEAAEPVVKTPPRSASDASLLTRGSLIRVGGKWVRESASPASSSTSPATSLTTLSFAATSNAAAARSLLTAVVNALEKLDVRGAQLSHMPEEQARVFSDGVREMLTACRQPAAALLASAKESGKGVSLDEVAAPEMEAALDRMSELLKRRDAEVSGLREEVATLRRTLASERSLMAEQNGELEALRMEVSQAKLALAEGLHAARKEGGAALAMAAAAASTAANMAAAASSGPPSSPMRKWSDFDPIGEATPRRRRRRRRRQRRRGGEGG